jgi:hypothetical protein
MVGVLLEYNPPYNFKNLTAKYNLKNFTYPRGTGARKWYQTDRDGISYHDHTLERKQEQRMKCVW